MKCEQCGAELKCLLVDEFDREGADSFNEYWFNECDENAVYIDTNANWTGYGLSDEEMPDTITCPFCHKYPFKDTEMQVYDIVRVVMFRNPKINPDEEKASEKDG